MGKHKLTVKNHNNNLIIVFGIPTPTTDRLPSRGISEYAGSHFIRSMRCPMPGQQPIRGRDGENLPVKSDVRTAVLLLLRGDGTLKRLNFTRQQRGVSQRPRLAGGECADPGVGSRPCAGHRGHHLETCHW